MEIDKTSKEEFKSLCKPLIEWLQKNCHPHARIIIETDHALMLEDILSITPFQDFLLEGNLDRPLESGQSRQRKPNSESPPYAAL